MIKERVVRFWLFVSYVVFQTVALILIGQPTFALLLIFALFPLEWVGELNKKTLLRMVAMFLAVSGVFAYFVTLLAALPLIVLSSAVALSALIVPYFLLLLVSAGFRKNGGTNKS